MHPGYANVGINLWKDERVGFFYFITKDNRFSLPYETIEQAQAARDAVNPPLCRNPNHALTNGTQTPHEIEPSCMAESDFGGEGN
jgi:hypothetical protein